MLPWYQNDGITILQGDVRNVLAQMPKKSVHCVVTSPPYWALREYGTNPSVWGGQADCSHQFASEHGQTCTLCGAWRGELGLEPTPTLYVEHMVEVFQAVRRVLRDDGTVWLNIGDSYNSNQGNGFDTNGDGGDRKAVAATKPIRWGKPKDMAMIPARVAIALAEDGWYLRSDIVWHKANPMPQSVTDRPTSSYEHVYLLAKRARYFYDQAAVREPLASDSAARALRTSRYDDPEVRASVPYARPRVTSGNLHRHAPEDVGRPADGTAVGRSVPWNNDGTGRNLRDVWTIPTKPYPGAHFATYPPALVEPCVQAGTSQKGVCAVCGAPLERVIERGESMWGERKASGAPMRAGDHQGGRTNAEATLGFDGKAVNQWKAEHPDRTVGWQRTCKPDCEGQALYPIPATVLDIFGGSGTTAVVARQLGRHAVLVELNTEYCELAAQRCATWHRQPVRLDDQPEDQLRLL